MFLCVSFTNPLTSEVVALFCGQVVNTGAVRKADTRASAVDCALNSRTAHQSHGLDVEVAKSVVFLTHIRPSFTLLFYFLSLHRDTVK